MQLVLDITKNNGRSPSFTMYCVLQVIMLPDVFRSACSAVMTDAPPSLRQVKIIKKYQRGYMFLYIALARYDRRCFDLYCLYMVFVLHAPSVFILEKRIVSFCFEKKLNREHVDHSKNGRARTPGFLYRNATRTLQFFNEMHCRTSIFCQ